jgi:hypothetical protein
MPEALEALDGDGPPIEAEVTEEELEDQYPGPFSRDTTGAGRRPAAGPPRDPPAASGGEGPAEADH